MREALWAACSTFLMTCILAAPPSGHAAGTAALEAAPRPAPQARGPADVPESETDALLEAIRIADGDSAMTALIRAVEEDPDHPRAAEALARAGFIAYVMRDIDQALRIFEMAEDAGHPQAKLWRGLALLSAGKPEAASRVLGDALGDLPDSGDAAAMLALASCKLLEGDIESGTDMCRKMADEGGRYSAAALLLLVRSAPGAVDPVECARWARLIVQRYPLSYEAAIARRLSEAASGTGGDAAVEEETVVEGPAEDASLEGAGFDRGASTGEHGVSAPGGEAPGDARGVESRPAAVYSVQVGAFSDARNAESLVQSLLEKGYDAVRIERETKKGMLFHCVRVGRFENAKDAEALAAALGAKEGLGTRVMREVPD